MLLPILHFKNRYRRYHQDHGNDPNGPISNWGIDVKSMWFVEILLSMFIQKWRRPSKMQK